METQKTQQDQKNHPPSAAAPPIASCRKKKNEDATFLEDLKDHIDEFIHASTEEHISCFKKTMNKMFGIAKVVGDRSSNSVKEVESSLPLKTVLSD